MKDFLLTAFAILISGLLTRLIVLSVFRLIGMEQQLIQEGKNLPFWIDAMQIGATIATVAIFIGIFLFIRWIIKIL